jgi:predicted amidophosphoribosyltransferase
MMSDVRIRCPKCSWEPVESSQWACSVCYTWWNTFSTGGRCPKCGEIYKHTQCLECEKWSPHLDWYEGLDNVIARLKEEIEKSWALPDE